MSAYGLKVMNDHGTVQIGSDYTNLVMTRKMTFSHASLPKKNEAGGNKLFVDYEIRKTDKELFVAVRSESAKNWLVVNSGRDVCVRLYGDSEEPGVSWDRRTCPTFEAFVFGYDDQRPTRYGYGLQVYNANGAVVYDSNKKYMKLLKMVNQRVNGDVYSFPRTQLFGNSDRRKKWAVVCGDLPNRFWAADDSVPTEYTFQGVLDMTRDMLHLDGYYYFEENGAGSGTSYQPSFSPNEGVTAMIVDVTNY